MTLDSFTTSGAIELRGHETQVSPHSLCHGPSDADVTITFIKPWGRNSWLVKFESRLYDNDRPPHVELRSQEELEANTRYSIYHTMIRGSEYKLKELHRKGDAIAWNVEGLMIENGKKLAHFTVHKGNRSLCDFLPTDITCSEEIVCHWLHQAISMGLMRSA